MGSVWGSYGVLDEGKARECQVVLFGHTHRPVEENRRGILLLNPGSLSYPRQEGRRPSYAVMELQQGKAPVAEIRYL